MSRPSFTLYSKYVLATGAEAIEVPLEGLGHDLAGISQKITQNTRLIFLDNPLNPTGAWLSQGLVHSLPDMLPPGALLVLDEAYADFARQPRPDYPSLLKTGKVIIFRTFSKLYGLAGLRVSYTLGDPQLIEALNKVRQPFNLNNLAQVGALAALGDLQHVQRTLDFTWKGLDYFQDALPQLGIKTYPTEANFILCGTANLSSDELASKLLKEGVIIRSLSSFGLSDKVRVTAGLPEENEALVKALERALEKP
jgi:histidinol-phosphate aminotransferase